MEILSQDNPDFIPNRISTSIPLLYSLCIRLVLYKYGRLLYGRLEEVLGSLDFRGL